MEALVLNSCMGVEGISLVSKDIPLIQKNEVLVRMQAAGIKPIDYKIIAGSSFAVKKWLDYISIGLGFEYSMWIDKKFFSKRI